MTKAAILLTAVLLSVAATPAAAQFTMPDNPDLKDVAIGESMGVCTLAMNGTGFDMNDAKALWSFGLTPDSAADEAELRQSNPGMESARATFANGSVIVGYVPGQLCGTYVTGPDRFAARDAIIAYMANTGAETEVFEQDGGTIQVFYFIHTKVGVFTPKNGTSIMIFVHPPQE